MFYPLGLGYLADYLADHHPEAVETRQALKMVRGADVLHFDERERAAYDRDNRELRGRG